MVEAVTFLTLSYIHPKTSDEIAKGESSKQAPRESEDVQEEEEEEEEECTSDPETAIAAHCRHSSFVARSE